MNQQTTTTKRAVDSDAEVSASKIQRTAPRCSTEWGHSAPFQTSVIYDLKVCARLYKLQVPPTADCILERLWTELYPKSKPESGILYGKRWDTAGRRQTIQVCDDKSLLYHYNGAASDPAVISFAQNDMVQYLHAIVTDCLGYPPGDPLAPNFCLLNFYTADGVLGWHSDDESDLVPDAKIVSLSYSTAPRYFEFRVKADHRHKWRLALESGSMLVMLGECQRLLQHCVPRQTLPPDFRRVNLTFRTIVKKKL